MADHIYDEYFCHFDPLSVKDGDIVYVNTFLLCPFFEALHPFIRARYNLITHNSDYGVPRTSIRHDFSRHLADPRILSWFTQNPTDAHPKLHPIPLGFAVDTKALLADWSASSAFVAAKKDFSAPTLDGRPNWWVSHPDPACCQRLCSPQDFFSCCRTIYIYI